MTRVLWAGDARAILHNEGTWCLTPADLAENLARKLTEMTCCCTAFAFDRYRWLNDATAPDGAVSELRNGRWPSLR